MNQAKSFTFWSCGSLITALAVLLVAGCESTQQETKPTAAAAPATAFKAIRVDAGSDTNYVDADGNVWVADQGFADGEVVTRDADLPVANTKDPALFRTEHYDMTSFSEKVPNGKYTVKLYFAETYEDITDAGQRVFSFNVAGQDFKDFDVFVKAGGAQKAYVVTVDDEVTNGEVTVTFTPNVQSPEINAIEILPAQ